MALSVTLTTKWWMDATCIQLKVNAREFKRLGFTGWKKNADDICSRGILECTRKFSEHRVYFPDIQKNLFTNNP